MKLKPTLSAFRGAPWGATAVLALILLLLILTGQWRSTAAGAQVQVPMFYDAHYLYPRPWTQAQEAPGVPEPFPVALYGPNTISQTFVSGANHLVAVEVWLHVPAEGRVIATLEDDNGFRLAADTGSISQMDEFVRFSFPTFREAEGRMFTLTLAAPEMTATNPAIIRVMGGDRLGGLLRLNEYARPGNLELRTYVTGAAFWDALGEQLLPDQFRHRLQQYKPPFFKGELFAGLLGVTAVLTLGILLLGRPGKQTAGQFTGWLLAGLLIVGLGWQIGSGRIHLSFIGQTVQLETAAASSPRIDNESWRVVNDLSAILWTAERLPEKRFVTTQLEPVPAIRVPTESALVYALDVPLNGRLRTGFLAEGAGSVRLGVEFNGTVVTQTIQAAAAAPIWLELDLTPWQGQGGMLRLTTEPVNGTPIGLWLMPQLLAKTDWLLNDLPETAVPVGYLLGQDIVLLGYEIVPARPTPQEKVTVTLYWRTERPLTQNGTVFVHALNSFGEIVAQSDSQPVQNSYPLGTWPPGVIVADTHQLVWSKDEPIAQIAVGLYDPTSLRRFPVQNPAGLAEPNDQVVLPAAENP